MNEINKTLRYKPFMGGDNEFPSVEIIGVVLNLMENFGKRPARWKNLNRYSTILIKIIINTI